MVKRLSDAAPSRSARIIATAYLVFTLPHIFTPHSCIHTPAAQTAQISKRLPPPAGGRRGRRPIRAPAPKTNNAAAPCTCVRTSIRVAWPRPRIAGRVTAAQCGSGPFGTGAAGGEPLHRQASSYGLLRKPQDTQESRAAELGRAADQRVPRGENGRGSMYSQQDHKTPAPGSTRGCGSHERYGRFTRKGHPSRGGIHSSGAALSGTLLSDCPRVGAASTQPHHFFF